MLNKKGFTIIELLIAMVVFSSMILIASFTIIQIGRIYYKGITTIKTQENTRVAMAAITEQVQFGKGSITTVDGTGPTLGFKATCIGNQRYSYVLDRIQGVNVGTTQGPTPDNPIPHTLWQDQISGGVCEPANLASETPPTAGGSDLLGEYMRLVDFDIRPTAGSLVDLSIRVMYGDNDLIERDGSNNIIGCATGIVGSQWCANSELTTQAFRRLTGN